jgi:hypothetical protein
MNGLMLHCGGQLKTKEEVFAVPPPTATESYVPLSYESFVTRIEKQLLAEDVKVKDERFALAKDGQRMFGLMVLELPGLAIIDHACVLGFRNSYDKSCSTGICVGATVFVCDNLSFSGSEVTFHRKHTTNLLRDLSWIITETISKLPARFAVQSECFRRYKELELSDKDAHNLVIRLYDSRAINVTEIPGVLKEWREPRHSEFLEAGKSGWRLFNAVTEIIKGDLWRLPSKTQALHEILDVECKFEEQLAQLE